MQQFPRIIIDTNVLVAALRSRRGWSFKLLSQAGRGHFEHVLTVPLLMEYEDVLLRPDMVPITAAAVHDVLDYLCVTAQLQPVHFLWRPQLPDAKDDMVLEAAVNGRCTCIVTWNVRDFVPARRFAIKVTDPARFLQQLPEVQP